MGLPEIIVDGSPKVKSASNLIKSRIALAWTGRSYPPPNLRGLNHACKVSECGRVGASLVFPEPLKDTRALLDILL